jgi:long-chain acyl-CoA synthetase
MYRAIEARAEAEGRKKQFEANLRIAKRVKDSTRVNIGRQLFAPIHRQLGGKLRFMFCGGAALNPDVALKYLRLGLPVIQGWGLTEAAPVAAAQRWSPYKFRFTNYYEERLGTVGEPLPEVEVKLIDVPEKEIYVHLHGEGELVLRGPNISPGYWKAPDETREARVGEWLRTGDLGRIDEEGSIWITGRSKYVIVLESGEKVVPDELEERLSESPLIEDICVVPRQIRNKTMVGAIIYPSFGAVSERCQAENAPLSEDTVRTLVGSELEKFGADMAPYKRISEIVLTDTPLPKTALRKVARGRMTDSHSFDLKRWERTSRAALGAAEEPAEDAEEGPEET